MAKVKQDVKTMPAATLQPATAPAPRAVPQAPAPAGFATAKDITPTSPSNKPISAPPGAPMSYTLQSADVGRTAIQFGGRHYNLLDHLGRNIETSDVGHVLRDAYTTDGWILSLS